MDTRHLCEQVLLAVVSQVKRALLSVVSATIMPSIGGTTLTYAAANDMESVASWYDHVGWDDCGRASGHGCGSMVLEGGSHGPDAREQGTLTCK